jgi:hypothetical protein
MSVKPEPKWSRSSKVVAIAIGIVAVALIVVLSVLLSFRLRPRGEKVGVVNLGDPLAGLVVNANRGDTLVFRVDASIGLQRLTLLSEDALEQRASKQLRSSLLTVRATSPSGGERVASCPVYKGRALSTSTTSASLTRTGMLNDCVIALDARGQWNVRASVAWASDVTVHSATLEARLEAAPR